MVDGRWVIERAARRRRWERHCAQGSEPTKHELSGWREGLGCVRATSPDGQVQIVWARASRYRITYRPTQAEAIDQAVKLALDGRPEPTDAEIQAIVDEWG